MMEKVKDLLKKIPDWVKAVVASAVIVAVAVLVNDVVQNIIHKHCNVVEDDFSCVFQVDSINENDGELLLDGWVFELGKDAREDDFEIVLYDYAKGKKYYPEMKNVLREDVEEYFLCEYDYSASGFCATIKTKKLDLKSTNYEILIQKSDEQEAFRTGIFISKGKLMYIKPEEYVPLAVEGTVLEEVVNNGVLRVYRPDVGLYLYQFEGKLYWIADEKFEFEEDDTTYLSYNLRTTQKAKIPEEKAYNDIYCEEGAIFEAYEIKEDIIGYRFGVRNIPKEYAVSKVSIGYYVKEWVWRQDFRPWYEFE